MSNTKYQISNVSQGGFTLIELLVVISIMGIMATLMLANFAGQRVARDMKIAQNELVTNIREIQSYTLSSRDIGTGQAVDYYVMKFDLSNPGQYTIEAMYDTDTSPQLADVQTILFPPNITLSSVSPVQIVRISPLTTQVPGYPTGCALVAFAAPFAQTLMNNGCSIASPPTIGSADDYGRIINFSANSESYSTSDNSAMVITLGDLQDSTVSNKVLVNGITGVVCPTQDGVTCLASN